MDTKSIASGLAPPFAGIKSFPFTGAFSLIQPHHLRGKTVLLFRTLNLCLSPFLCAAGTLPFELCQRYVEGIVLINDEEITAAVSTLYRSGLVVEPSGCAAFAAIVSGKIPELEGKNVVCILSGGNIGKDELVNFPG